MAGHRDLIAWQQALELVRMIYRSTRTFPKDKVYGLSSQLRRAAVSIPSNLAEGYGRNSRRELHQYVGQARGSLCEVETQVEIARDLVYIDSKSALELLAKVARVGRLLTGLRDWSETAGPDSSDKKRRESYQLRATSYQLPKGEH
jgi:four helix bundle protein